ncbi:Glycoprotein-N-acetylgalactosamine 3-beta-galactosyltransferase 1 [Diplonema papillatum]|nr:Glycoprotein-N-acetylgalactosamine 3-beta-galactosyltransferase 1 [Diplonema papillatum]
MSPPRRGGSMRLLVAVVVLLSVFLWWRAATWALRTDPNAGKPTAAARGYAEKTRKPRNAAPPEWVSCTSEGGTCSCSGAARFGAGSRWSAPRKVCGAAGSEWKCTSAAFGGADPAPGEEKECQCLAKGAPPASTPCLEAADANGDVTWEHCAEEGGEDCKCKTAVRFGSPGKPDGWHVKRVCDEEWFLCGAPAFGGGDPAPGDEKQCECAAAPSPSFSSLPCLITAKQCEDQVADCIDRKESGLCTSQAERMAQRCRKTCGLCSGGGEPAKEAVAQVRPRDVSGPTLDPSDAKHILAQVQQMQREPYVDPTAWRREELEKYPDLKHRPNPIGTCRKNADAFDTLVAKVKIAPRRDGPKILCLVYTMAGKTEQLQAIRDTYAPHCDGFLAMSTETHPDTQQTRVFHKGSEAYNNMWQKSRSIWAYVAEEEKRGKQYDFFIIGGDDLYVIVDNLRAYLGSSEIVEAGTKDGIPGAQPLFLGRRFNESHTHIIFNSGGAGYVLNAAALQLLYSRLDLPVCQPDSTTSAEDRNVALCFRAIQLFPHDTRDAKREERFMPFTPDLHYVYRIATAQKNDWYKRYSIGLKEGIESASEEAVSFHYLKPPAMRRLHALLYSCREQDGE